MHTLTHSHTHTSVYKIFTQQKKAANTEKEAKQIKSHKILIAVPLFHASAFSPFLRLHETVAEWTVNLATKNIRVCRFN